VFDHFRGNLTAADILADSFAAAAVGAAERAFPVLRLVPVEDAAPLARPPVLDAVPAASPRMTGARPLGIAASLALAFAGAGVLSRGRRPRAAR
jgi:nitrous oxidase accessory protein